VSANGSATLNQGTEAPRSWQSEWRWLSLALAGLAALASWGHWTWHLDQAVYDAALSTWTRPAPADIVIVAIDDASLAAIGRWPWRRAIHAQALSRINQAHPRSVLINLLMTEPDLDPEQDRLLAKAMAQSGRVVLPVGHALDGLGQGHALLPIAPLRAHAHLAHADVSLDVDGVLRSAWLNAGTDAQIYPHPALALLKVGAGESIAAEPPAASSAPASGWQRTDRMAIRYQGAPGLVHQVSYADLLRGAVPDSALRGRDVLIGVTARGLADDFLTPVSGMHASMSGVEVSGQLLSSLRTGTALYSLPRSGHAALAAALVFALAWSFRQVTPRQALINAMSLSAACVILSWLMMSLDIWAPPFGTVLAALLAYPVWSWRRLESTAKSLERALHAIGTPHSDARPLTLHDTTGRRNDFMSQRTDALHMAGTQLREARQLLADTLTALPDAVFVTDSSGRITQANRQAALLSDQADAVSLIGVPLEVALAELTPKDAPNWSLLVQRALQSPAGLSTEAEQSSVQQDGRQFLVHIVPSLTHNPIAGEKGDAHGVIACLTDTSELRRTETQRKELLGFIAHDMRSPQASLIALVDLHKMGDPMTADEVFGHVETLAHQTLDLCEELLQVMRAETRPLTLKQVDLYSLAEECMETLGLQGRARGIQMSGDWSGETRLNAEVDDYLVQRAMVNLLSNAVKFSPDGGAIKISITEQDKHHVIAIQDEGPGIPASELGRLFRRYERVEQGRPSQLAAGIGLGLVFIETVARRHGGRVHVSSQPGQGSCFELWLPIEATKHSVGKSQL
jgi:CHASE2 domain-containing sensor protein/signal transduction histidine kinase